MTRKTRSDIDGDGAAEIVITSPAGLGVLKLVRGQFTALTTIRNGARLGDWSLDTRTNRVVCVADLDGDGRSELFVTSPRGVAALQLQRDTFTAPAMAPAGARLGAWPLQTLGDVFGPAADLDGDGRSELLVTSARGLGVLALAGDRFTALATVDNGASLDGWTLATAEDRFTRVGDLDGDGAAEILVTGPRGLTILKLVDGALLRNMLHIPNGAPLGDRTLDTRDDHVIAVTDLDGDGRAELLISSRAGLGVYRLSGATLAPVLHVPGGAQLGAWTLDTVGDRIGPAADLDGDGCHELLVTSARGLGVLKLVGHALSSVAVATNGAQLGAWHVHTARHLLCSVTDLDGDGRAELLLSSPWGLGALALAGGQLTAVATVASGAQLGDWPLDAADDRVEPG